jgi:hypothetical protein
MCVPERTLQDRVTGHLDNDDMYLTFATHVLYTHITPCAVQFCNKNGQVHLLHQGCLITLLITLLRAAWIQCTIRCLTQDTTPPKSRMD